MTRDATGHVVTQFSDSENENHDVRIEILTVTTLITLLLICQALMISCYNELILCCQTHVHAVEITNVEVIAGGNSEGCEKFDFFEN